MSVENEIEYRASLIAKVHNGSKLTASERQWLLTHPSYNRKYGYPYLNSDKLKLRSNTLYNINITLESKLCSEFMCPFIGVAYGKGEIRFREKSGALRSTKNVGVIVDDASPSKTVDFKSNNGILSVKYQCERIAEHSNSRILDISDGYILSLAMQKEQISPNKVLYKCKTFDSESFDNFIFSLEWIEC